MSPALALDLPGTTWRKSTYSNGQGGECLEIAGDVSRFVPVRDSKTPSRPALVFHTHTWSSFVTAVQQDALAPSTD